MIFEKEKYYLGLFNLFVSHVTSKIYKHILSKIIMKDLIPGVNKA